MDPWITATDVLADRAFCNLDLEDEDLVDRATDAAAATIPGTKRRMVGMEFMVGLSCIDNSN